MGNKVDAESSETVIVSSEKQVWDWTDDDNFKNFNGNQIPTPWPADFHSGIDLTQADRCPFSEGWRLYIKRLEAEDYSGKAKSEITTQDTQPEYPYFALYNKYTGILRLFVYMGGDNTAGEDNFIFNAGITDGAGTPNKDVGLFLNNSDQFASSLEDKSSEYNQGHLTIFRAVYKKWMVTDYELSYDPGLSGYSNTYFTVNLDARDIEDISLSGDFQFTVEEFTTDKKNVVNSALNGNYNSSYDYSQRIAGLEKFKNTLKDDGNKSGGKIKNSLANFADAIDPVSGLAEKLSIPGASYINSFTNTFGSSSSSIQFSVSYSDGVGDINLNGNIVDNIGITDLQFGLPLVSGLEEADSPTYQKQLGLFSLDHKPQVQISKEQFGDHYEFKGQSLTGYHEAVYIDLKDISISINPESNMELKKIAYSPIIDASGDFLTTYGQSWYFPIEGESDHDTYDIAYSSDNQSMPYTLHSFNGLLSYGTFKKGKKTETNYDRIILGPTESVNLKLNYNIPNRDFQMFIGDVYIRYYFIFENKNDSSIKAEFIKTYKAEKI